MFEVFLNLQFQLYPNHHVFQIVGLGPQFPTKKVVENMRINCISVNLEDYTYCKDANSSFTFEFSFLFIFCNRG